MKIKCGDANPKGNVSFLYKGGCGKELNIKDAYRCTGCGGWFHKKCILKHFKLEKTHDFGRNSLRKEIIYRIKNYGGFEDDAGHFCHYDDELIQIIKNIK